MENINVFIKEKIRDEVEYDIMVMPDIENHKLNNAIESFGCKEFYQSILAIYDSTKFRSAKEGLVFTGEKMIYKNQGNHWTFPYKKIESLNYQYEFTKGRFGQENFNQWLLITMDGKEYKLEKLDGLFPSQYFSFESLSNFLQKIIDNFDEYKEENQLKTIAEMPDELKIAYLKIIVNMTFSDDQNIDEKELAELFLLMTRLELNRESRFKIRTYITEMSVDSIEPVETLLETIKSNAEASHYQALIVSLAKDLINIYFSTKDTLNRNFTFLSNYQALFKLSDEKIQLAYDTVENDHKLINEDLDDSTIEKNAKELAAKAAAAGVPLAAVYISGSVIGMSAAGITSGLATLGMGMTGGLAAIAIIGVLSYKGVKHLTGANELDKYKTRELMLHDVIKQTQKTISQIIGDINHIVQKLNETALNHAEQTEKIKKLMQMMAQFQGALKNVDNKSNTYQISASRLQNPKVLDEERLKSLTSEPTKKPLYDFIIVNYELKMVSVDNKEVKKLALKDHVSSETLEKMSEIFKVLGYFDMENILKGKLSGLTGLLK